MSAERKLRILAIASVLLLLIAVPAAADTVIVHTNDVHGRLSDNIGYDGLAAYITDLKNSGDTVLLFDAGDTFQGLADVNYFEGASAADIMNAVGYTAMAPGNHDFDFGVDNLLSLAHTLDFPVLCLNVLDTATGKPLFETSHIFEADGMKIGVFGVLAPETGTVEICAEGIDKLTFLGGEELYTAVQNEVDLLKSQGCTYIIGLSHLGLDAKSEPNRSSDLAANVTGIDLIIDGHSHTELPEGMLVNSTLIVSTGEYLEYIGVVRLSDGKPAVSRVSSAEYTKKDPEITALIQEWTAEVDEALSQVIATTAYDLNGDRSFCRTQETNLGDLLTDAFLWYVNEQGLSADGALVNGGAIRESVPAGDITLKSVNSVQPFGNTLLIMETTGAALLAAMEANTATVPEEEGGFPQVSGIEYTLDTDKTYVPGEISRVTITSVNGKPFEEDEIYYLATNDYIAAGGDKYAVFAGSEYVDLGITTDTVLVRYITDVLGGYVDETYAEPQGRITVTGSGSAAQSPVPVLGILAGLAASLVIIGRNRP